MDNTLNRPRVEAMDAILGHTFPVLDKGFIRVIDYMGDEAAFVQAARVSYGEGTKTAKDDAALCRYLLGNHHTSPFEMAEIKLHVKMPIFVARQWVRHRTASLNEYSGRYSEIRPEFYIPGLDHLGRQSTSNKQGREGGFSAEEGRQIRATIQEQSERAFQVYRSLLDEADLSRELARMVLPLNLYTEWYWKIDIHNLFHFLRLRMDSHAQREIRDYATAIAEIVEMWMPNVWQAFLDYQVDSITFSGPEQEAIRGSLEFRQFAEYTKVLDAQESRMSSREKFNLPYKMKQALGVF